MDQKYLNFTPDCRNCINKPCNEYYNQSGMQTFETNVCTNSGFNYGVSSNLRYDSDYIEDDIQQSTSPLMSVLDPNRVKNCSQCFSMFSPRGSTWGNSIAVAEPSVTPAQDLVDIDSIMSNRNVKQDMSKKGKVNTVDVFKFKTYNSKECNRGLDPMASISTFPKQLYREMSINRFYDLNLNPQVNIYWDGAVNSQLEAKDNYDYPYPFFLDEHCGPTAQTGAPGKPCATSVYNKRGWIPETER